MAVEPLQVIKSSNFAQNDRFFKIESKKKVTSLKTPLLPSSYPPHVQIVTLPSERRPPPHVGGEGVTETLSKCPFWVLYERCKRKVLKNA